MNSQPDHAWQRQATGFGRTAGRFLVESRACVAVIRLGRSVYLVRLRPRTLSVFLNAALALVSLVVVGSLTAVAQSRPPVVRPNLEGTWMLNVEAEIKGRVRPPFQPWAEQFFKEARSGEQPDPGASCLAPGVPRIMYAPYPFEIFQRDNRVDLLHEYQHVVRRIWTDGRKHPDNLDPTWMGHSVGRYEGDTLVVDTVGLNDRTWLNPGGYPHSDQLHVVERFRRVGDSRLNVEITIDDLKAYTKVWTLLLTFDLKEDWEIYEYVCEENNKAQPKAKVRP